MNEHYNPESLVGAVALEVVLSKLRSQLENDADFRGAFHVLSGFSAEQLIGFIQAKNNAGVRASKIEIQFPDFAMQKFQINRCFLTAESAVSVRNRERNGLVTITAEMEADAEASLADSDRTDASDLKDKSVAPVWVDFVTKVVGINLLPEDRRKVEALLRGLFGTGRCSAAVAGQFLASVLEHFKTTPLSRAAGKSLPVLGLPLFEDCFSSLNEAKMAQAAQWLAKFNNHYALECFLDKRGHNQELLDPEELRQQLEFLQSEEQQPPIPDSVLQAFEAYIGSEGGRNQSTERLFFDFDWNLVGYCFDKTKKSGAKSFADRTHSALVAEGVILTDDDELVIKALKGVSRRTGHAPDEFREFFERRSEQLEKDAGLFVEWEDFVHGKKIECTDLFHGLFECLQRTVRGLSPNEQAHIVLEGRRQKKPNSFLEMNYRACQYFERAYGGLETFTKKKVRFKDTLICSYSDDVYPRIKDNRRFKGAAKSKKATTLDFLVSVFQKQKGAERKVATLSLRWVFPINSVLTQELTDFGAICRFQEQRGTALVGCVAEYEVIGRKGTPVPLSLENVEGLADKARGGGRGAFVPAQDRIESLVEAWDRAILDGRSQRWLPDNQASELESVFRLFESGYGEAILALRDSALNVDRIDSVASSYRQLLLLINSLQHQELRHQLLRVILRVGLAQVPRAGRRPSVVVVCPWHPLRMEAAGARVQQISRLLNELLSKDRPPFSDGGGGSLFFREVDQLLEYPLYPQMAVVWESMEPSCRVVSQAYGSYTLHQPPEPARDCMMQSSDDEVDIAAQTIEHEMKEYLRLQPHERNNFSILLYNCDSSELPTAVVKSINRINSGREDDKITCQILLMHNDEEHLRHMYRDLVVRGLDTEAGPTEGSGDFLAKVRVNITAANRLRRNGRSQPVDIAYCRDLLSRESEPVWEWCVRETVSAADLQPHQWSRRVPVREGDRRVWLQLACPAQTETGWAYLYSLAGLCAQGADHAWAAGQCPILMRRLNFDDQRVDQIFREAHELATWVVSQDELLDRKLLEARNVKVIRYIQSATHGRNLVISSDARETLLINTLREKLKALLSSETPAELIHRLCGHFMSDANKISGGLVLKAARRANNTNELLGMVLSRYLVQAELGADRPIAWCFLDDYSQWLGKAEGANIADLLVLAPRDNTDGSKHLDIVVTEAKFITHDALGGAASTSSKQLVDTLSQITEAMDGDSRTIDQEIWLARLSDLLVSQTVVAGGLPPLDTLAWRRAIRQRQCSVSIWGYSHVFVYEPCDLAAQVSSVKGVTSTRGRSSLDAFQEIFGPGHVRELIGQYEKSDYKATANLRLRNGHPAFGRSKLYHLVSKPKETVSSVTVVPKVSANEITEKGNSTSSSDLDERFFAEREGEGHSTTWGHPDGLDGQAKTSSLIDFLQKRSQSFRSSNEEGIRWLNEVSITLRQVLVSRGLPARLTEGCPPILTPNAGIFKLQGSKDLTVQAVEQRADEIFTSEGIKIISTTPESGRISISVERPQRQVLHTEAVLLEYLRSYGSNQLGEKLCVGIREEDGKPLLLDPFNQPHTLIAGITGSGKSVLVQNLILSIAASRKPEEAHIYLIDPKYGLDYRPLDELPHVKLGSGGIIDDATQAVAILDKLVSEMNRRYELFKGARVANIHGYRAATGNALPTLWVIHDEFADWMQTDNYREAVPNIVGRLSVKARAAGIFLMFAAQRPDKDVMPMQLRSQLGNRLILKVDNGATAEIAMGVKNSGAERLLGRGHMLAKIGDMLDPVYAQVPLIDVESIKKLVELIQRQHMAEAIA